jgi:cytochrome oxidase Cu insertion factor (SCO1/SenC/PrrC family)
LVPLVAAALAAGCGIGSRLPEYGQVPRFRLVAQNGDPFDRGSLDGNVWVADFIFTTCPARAR